MAQRFGARTTFKEEVYLNVYDLAPLNDYAHPVGLGVYHSGVQVGGKEYTFAGGAGIFDHEPKQAPNAKFRESVLLGYSEGGSGAVSSAVSNLRSDFGGDKYNILLKNCNTFSDAFCTELLGKGIPAYVNRLAWMGSWFSCCIPPEMLGQAPVNDGSSSGPAAYQMITPANRRVQTAATQGHSQTSFGGSGATLGSVGGNSKTSDIREARLRALQSRANQD